MMKVNLLMEQTFGSGGGISFCLQIYGYDDASGHNFVVRRAATFWEYSIQMLGWLDCQQEDLSDDHERIDLHWTGSRCGCELWGNAMSRLFVI